MSRRLLLGLTATLALAGLPAQAATADGGVDATAACRGTSGVTVIVDYRQAAPGIDVRCAPGDPATGLAALTGAGLPYTFVPGQPGLVCTIKMVPDPCNGAPVNAYWSYWHLRANGTWQFSSTGAGSYNPAPGATEGWAFGSGQPPRKPRPPATAAHQPDGALASGGRTGARARRRS